MTRKKTDKPSKIEDREIFTWSPDQAGQPHIARIDGFPTIATGDTSEAAAANMRTFRDQEIERMARDEERRVEAGKRLAESRAALRTTQSQSIIGSHGGTLDDDLLDNLEAAQ